MIARIWGTRGSYPVAQAEMMRYGGNTACVEVRVGETCIVLDAGTGLRLLGNAMAQSDAPPPERIHLLITHTHWDHIIGFPFFEPIYDSRVSISIYGLRRTQPSLRATLANAVSDPLLPISLESLNANLAFHEINHTMCFSIGDHIHVSAAQVNHPYRALGYRVESSDGILVFIPDTGPFHTILFSDERVVWTGKPAPLSVEEQRALARMREAIVKLCAGADWIIYDSQFTPEQYLRFPHWGHSTPDQALDIAREAGVRELLLFHHDPHRTDAELDLIGRRYAQQAPPGMRVCVAYEGMELRREH